VTSTPPDSPTQADLDRAVTAAVQHVAQALDQHMTARNLTVRDVAIAAGISVGTVHGVRHGTTRLEARVLARLETALGAELWPRRP